MTRRLVQSLCWSLLVLALFANVASAGGGPGLGQQPPANTSAPTLSGIAAQGSLLTAGAGGWTGVSLSFAYGWLRCDLAGNGCSALPGQKSAAYALTAADVGSTVRVVVTASNKNGSQAAVSATTTLVASATTVAPATSVSAASAIVAESQPPSPPPTTSSRFGFAAGGNIQNLSATDLARYLDGVQAAHAGWVRIDINWEVIQHGGPSSYNWAPFDAVVNAARSRGLQVLGGILYTPAWARAAGTTPSYPPTTLSDYATFSRAAVAHFAPEGVHAYEIWNEPNTAGFWAPAPNPAAYTQLLKLAYTAIKAADPSAAVLSAGLSPYGSYGQSDAQHMNPLNFLEAMYANGAAGSFDALAWHPYNFPYGLGYTLWSAWSQMSQTSPSARSIMIANGDSAKQIWATEFGMPTGTSTRAVSETIQAQFVTDAYAQLKSWSWVGPAFLYSYHDNGSDPTNIEDNFGVIHFDWTPKLAYTAYQTAAAAG